MSLTPIGQSTCGICLKPLLGSVKTWWHYCGTCADRDCVRQIAEAETTQADHYAHVAMTIAVTYACRELLDHPVEPSEFSMAECSRVHGISQLKKLFDTYGTRAVTLYSAYRAKGQDGHCASCNAGYMACDHLPPSIHSGLTENSQLRLPYASTALKISRINAVNNLEYGLLLAHDAGLRKYIVDANLCPRILDEPLRRVGFTVGFERESGQLRLIIRWYINSDPRTMLRELRHDLNILPECYMVISAADPSIRHINDVITRTMLQGEQITDLLSVDSLPLPLLERMGYIHFPSVGAGGKVYLCWRDAY